MDDMAEQPAKRDSSIEIPGLGRSISSRTFVSVAVAVALVIRAAWAFRYGLSIEMEGTEYGRLADNLLHGRGYVGMYNNGTQVIFPPLYPLVIAAVSVFTRNMELSQRLINVLCGAALVIPMFGIGKRLYGSRVAVTLAALVVFHPVLVAGGGSTYSEGPYLLLLMSGLNCLMKSVLERRVRASASAGVFFGLGYLARPEAFLLVVAFVGCGVLGAVWASDRRTALRGPLVLAVAFALVALPQVVFLTVTTGKVRVEAKGALNYQVGSRMHSGMSLQEALNGIGEDLTPQGAFIRPNLDVIRTGGPASGDYFRLFGKAAPRNLSALVRGVVDQAAFGSPLLFALVVLGLFGRGWDRRRLVLDGLLLVTAGVILFVLIMVPSDMLWFRYFYPLVGVLLIWGAKGIDDFSEWARASVASLSANVRKQELAATVVKAGALVAVLAVAFHATLYVDQFRESLYPERARAGRWLGGQAPARPWVMDTELQIAYYADGKFSPLPYATEAVALRYIQRKNPDFIVLRSLGRTALPYTEAWFDHGIPDRHAVLVYDDAAAHPLEQRPPKPRAAAEDAIKIYRWTKDAS